MIQLKKCLKLFVTALLLTIFSEIFAQSFPVVRIPVEKRNFTSSTIENEIAAMQQKIKDPELAWMFANCFPNTLDRTVNFTTTNGKANTFVITGDIFAMWLRDSSAQVWPYLPFMQQDKKLQQLIAGVKNRQIK